ncbi:MAG: thioredoxin [Actinomycetota bacterium]|nr:thioredoxin [Actinomycetota bacterium]
MGENIVEVNEESFEVEVSRSEKPVLVDFWAPWCGPCVVVAPVVEDLARQYSDKLKFAKINVDNNQRLAGQYNIRGIPTFIVFVNGEAKKRFMGSMPKERFIVELSEWLE